MKKGRHGDFKCPFGNVGVGLCVLPINAWLLPRKLALLFYGLIAANQGPMLSKVTGGGAAVPALSAPSSKGLELGGSRTNCGGRSQHEIQPRAFLACSSK